MAIDRGGNTMRFEARDLKPKIEPVKSTDLAKNEVYFVVSYADDEKLTPVLEPYQFIGHNIISGDSAKLYFKSMDPVRQRIRRASQVDYLIESEGHPSIFEYEQALEELMLCSLRRQRLLGSQEVDSGNTPREVVSHFDARELKIFAEPMKPADLRLDSIYFSFFFVDDDLLIPGLEPYVFVGRDLDPEEAGLYFQDIDSYRRGVRYGIATDGMPAMLVVDSDESVNHFQYEEALEQLMVCFLRRQGVGSH